MDANDNPYEILGVPPTATAGEIRSAYRKLALQTHPDKQRNEQDRQHATQRFAKVSNAYEILSDPEQRLQYDRLLQQQQQEATIPPLFATAATGGGGGMPDIFQQFFRHSMFHDPFQVFEQFFRNDMTMTGASDGGLGSSAAQSTMPGAMMNDPFSLMMGGPSLLSGGGFGGDLFGMGTAAAAGGSMGNNLFGTPAPYSNAMLNAGTSLWNASTGIQQQQQQQMARSGGSSSSAMFFSSSSTSSSSQLFGGGGGGTGETVTVQTTMRSINGQPPRMVQERIVHKPDGTVERTVMQSENGTNARSNHSVAVLEAPEQAQQQQQQFYLPSSAPASLQQQQSVADSADKSPPISSTQEDAGTKATVRKKRSHTENNHQNEASKNLKRPKEALKKSNSSAKKKHQLYSNIVNDTKKVKVSSVTTKQEMDFPMNEKSITPKTATSNGTQKHTIDLTSFQNRDTKAETTGIVNKSNTERRQNDAEDPLSSPKESSSKAVIGPADETKTETSSGSANSASKSGSDHDGNERAP